MSFLSTAVRQYRISKLQQIMDIAHFDALILSGAEWFEFATNHAITVAGWERPYAVVITRDGRTCALMHDLSSVRANNALRNDRMWLDQAVYYAEVPHVSSRRPLLPLWAETFANILQQLGLTSGRVGVDVAPAPMQRLGHLLPDIKVLPAIRWLRDARLVKHIEEIELLRAAASLSDWAIGRYLAEIRPGRNLQELDYTIAAQTCVEAGNRFPGEDFQVLRFMSLSGPASAAAHGDASQSGATVLSGAVTVTICNVRLNGMSMENQRTFAVGHVDERTTRLMQVALEANEKGLLAAETGKPLAGIDEAALEVITAAGYGPYVLHRTGHGIGVGTHEYPEDMAYDTRPLLKDEAIIVEPGIYIPGLGGFRYVDGVIVGTKPERLTHAPKDFFSMCVV